MHGLHPQIFADLAFNMRINPEDVTQKDYLDEGGFGCVYLATVKMQVLSACTYIWYLGMSYYVPFNLIGSGDQAGSHKDIHSARLPPI